MTYISASYENKNQLDCLKFCPIKEDNNISLLAVSFSSLEGNEWDGGIALLDGDTAERLCITYLETGINEISWTKTENSFIISGTDDANVMLIKVLQDVDFTLSVEIIGKQSGSHDDIVSSVDTNFIKTNEIITGSWDRSVKLWDIEMPDTCIEAFEGHTELVWCVRWNKHCTNTFLSSSQDKTVQLWDKRSCIPCRNNNIKQEFPVTCLEWHSKNENIFSAGLKDGTIFVYDTRSFTTPFEIINEHKGAIYALSYSPHHDDLLVSGSDDSNINIYKNSSQGNMALSGVIEDHIDYVKGIEWNPHKNNSLGSCSWDKTLKIFELDTI